MTDNLIAEMVFKQLMTIPENTKCFDCGKIKLIRLMMIEGNVNPLWASINNGVFVCLSCSGLHRGLGVQMSQVRSLTLDSWTERQLKSMSLGGNKSLKDFFNTYDLNEESVQTKYRSRASAYYRSKVSTIFLFEN